MFRRLWRFLTAWGTGYEPIPVPKLDPGDGPGSIERAVNRAGERIRSAARQLIEKDPLRRVVVESPFAARPGQYTEQQAAAYLDMCLLDCYTRFEAPHASHAIGPRVLDDTNPSERDLGIRGGYAWQDMAQCVVFYVDLGWSRGMLAALSRVRKWGIAYEIRTLNVGIEDLDRYIREGS